MNLDEFRNLMIEAFPDSVRRHLSTVETIIGPQVLDQIASGKASAKNSLQYVVQNMTQSLESKYGKNIDVIITVVFQDSKSGKTWLYADAYEKNLVQKG